MSPTPLSYPFHRLQATCTSPFCNIGHKDQVNSTVEREVTMKQELHVRPDNKSTSPVQLPAARARLSRIVKDSPRSDPANGSSPQSKARPKPISVDSRSISVDRKAVVYNKMRPAVNGEEAKVPGVPRSQMVEQYARLRQRVDANGKGSEEAANLKVKELQSRVDESGRLLRDSESEVLALKAQIGRLQVINAELESQKKKLEEDLSAAQAKIKILEKHDRVEPAIEFQNSREIDSRRESILKLQSLVLKPTAKSGEAPTISLVKKPVPPVTSSQAAVAAAPPPPPPPPQHGPGRAKTVHKASALVELYQSLTKRDGKQSSINSGGCGSPLSNNVNSIVGELQNRSAHLLAIKSDIETKGHLIKHLIEKVRSASFANMEEALSFVDWLDAELSTLADERAVLKHFDWPEKKADALREAAFEFRHQKQVEAEVSSVKDDASLPCEATLKKISNSLDRLERSMDRLIKLRTTSMLLFRDCNIPTDWMLDSGLVSKMKHVAVKLAKVYMRRVSMELESARHSERETVQEALLFEAVRFAYRAHQFAGGLDSETMSIFEELKGCITRSKAVEQLRSVNSRD